MKSSALAICSLFAASLAAAAEPSLTVTRDVPYVTPV
ncbi:MAG: hypothetical protein RLZZ221_2990, partial [Verrucomicrobiota bacterium]